MSWAYFQLIPQVAVNGTFSCYILQLITVTIFKAVFLILSLTFVYSCLFEFSYSFSYFFLFVIFPLRYMIISSMNTDHFLASLDLVRNQKLVLELCWHVSPDWCSKVVNLEVPALSLALGECSSCLSVNHKPSFLEQDLDFLFHGTFSIWPAGMPLHISLLYLGNLYFQIPSLA